MKNHMRFAAMLLLPLLTQACGGGEPATEEAADSAAAPAAPAPAPAAPATGAPTVTIVSPTEGQSVVGPNVTVRLEAGGVTIVAATNHDAGTGHHHLFIDRDPTPLTDTIPAGVSDIRHLGQGQTEFSVEGLAPGPHRVIAVIADWSHVPLNPPAVDTVRFTVTAPPEQD